MLLGRQEDRDALACELGAIFPAPGNIERVWLYTELLSILKDVPWVRPHVGGNEIDVVLEDLHLRAYRLALPGERGAPVTLLVGDHGYAGAMIGLGSAPPAMRRLKGLVWIAMRRWLQAGHLPCSAADAATSALRAAIRTVRSRATMALYPVLVDLAAAHDMPGAILALSQLESSSHHGLRDAWVGLRRVLTAPPTNVAATGNSESDNARPRLRARLWLRRNAKNVDRGEIELARPEVIPLHRRRPIPDQAPGEPSDEFSATADLVVVPGFGTGAVSRRRAEYEARQAIWSGNVLLLSSHVEALPHDVYGAALRALVADLDRDDGPHTLGNLVCLLKALSGRTTAGIRWLCAGDLREQAAGIEWDRGAIEFPPFWKTGFKLQPGAPESDHVADPVGYFRASKGNCQDWLVPASSRISLPLARPIHRVLSRHLKSMQRVAELEELAIDRAAAEAGSRLDAALEIPLTAACLRRSLGPQIMDVSGDLALAQLICGDSFGRRPPIIE